MKKNYLIPEVELFEVQQTTATLLTESVQVENGYTDGKGDPIGPDPRVNESVFEW